MVETLPPTQALVHVPERLPSPDLRFGSYYPRHIVTNDELVAKAPLITSAGKELSPEDIYRKVGVKTRGVADEDETVLEMGLHAARQALSSVREPIYAVFVPTSFTTGEYTALKMAQGLGIITYPQELHDVHAACSGTPYTRAYKHRRKKRF